MGAYRVINVHADQRHGLESAKLATVPSRSLPVRVTAIEVASSAPLAETVSLVGASLTGVTVMVAVA